MDELASFLTPSSRLDVKLLALQQVGFYMRSFTSLFLPVYDMSRC